MSIGGQIPEQEPLSGAETFRGTGLTVLDFWRYAMPDLRMNNVRGYLAEYLVARAVGAQGTRVEWDAYDVLAPTGTRIEVKARGYLQVWPQPRGPVLGPFRVSASDGWDSTAGRYLGKGWHADVYVLCVHIAQDHESYDVLDIGQWEFFVVPRSVIVSKAGGSMNVTWLREVTGGATEYLKLAGAVESVRQHGLDGIQRAE